MNIIETLSLKETRGGFRVYLNNKTQERIGFTAGVGFKEVHEVSKARIIVYALDKGVHMITKC